MADRIGQQLGNYRLIRSLGKGGFAEVYLGEHVYIRTQAAIKVLSTQLAGEDIEQFRVEATTLAHLEHPHIVRVLDFGVEGTTPFLVMSYAAGGTLRQRHPKGTILPLLTIITYVQQVADALQYAHDQKLIHRDVKPENMLLGQRQEVLLSDFGIALVAQTSRHQLTQPATGTVAYMAPEQIQGKPRPQSDQYSLGIIVYEWLSGTLPFTGSALELFGQHLHVPPTPLCEKVPSLSREVEQVVMLALAKDPKQRWASVQAFATALEQASQVSPGETVLSSQSPPSPDELTALRETQQPTKLATSLGQSSLLTELSPPSSHTALPADALTVPSESQQATELVAPPSQASLPTEAATRSMPSLQPAQTTRSNDLSGPTEAAVTDIPSSQPTQPKKKRSSRKPVQSTKMPALPQSASTTSAPKQATSLPSYKKQRMTPIPDYLRLSIVLVALNAVIFAWIMHAFTSYDVFARGMFLSIFMGLIMGIIPVFLLEKEPEVFLQGLCFVSGLVAVIANMIIFRALGSILDIGPAILWGILAVSAWFTPAFVYALWETRAGKKG